MSRRGWRSPPSIWTRARFAAAERELGEFVGNVDRPSRRTARVRRACKPLQARGAQLLGHALYRMGHLRPAIEVLDMALADAGDEAARRAQILGGHALALGGLGHHDEAIAERPAGAGAGAGECQPAARAGLRPELRRPGPQDAIGPILKRAGDRSRIHRRRFRTLALAETAARRRAARPSMLLQRALRQNPSDSDAILQLSLSAHREGSSSRPRPCRCWSPI